MSEEPTLADFAVMFRLGPNKITMGKEDAVRLAELMQKSSDELKRLRALVEENGTEIENLRAAICEWAASIYVCEGFLFLEGLKHEKFINSILDAERDRVEGEQKE